MTQRLRAFYHGALSFSQPKQQSFSDPSYCPLPGGCHHWTGQLEWTTTLAFLGVWFHQTKWEESLGHCLHGRVMTQWHFRNTPPPSPSPCSCSSNLLGIQFILWRHANYARSARGGAACCRQTSQLGLERLHTLYGHMYQRIALKCYLIVGCCIFKRLCHKKSCGVAAAHRQMSTSSWNRMYYRTSHSGTRGQYKS